MDAREAAETLLAHVEEQYAAHAAWQAAPLPPLEGARTAAGLQPRLRKPVYEGAGLTLLEVLAVEMQHKLEHHHTDAAFEERLRLLADYELPQPNSCPRSQHVAERLLGVPNVRTITRHVCVNDCHLFDDVPPEDYDPEDACPVCNEPRFVVLERADGSCRGLTPAKGHGQGAVAGLLQVPRVHPAAPWAQQLPACDLNPETQTIERKPDNADAAGADGSRLLGVGSAASAEQLKIVREALRVLVSAQPAGLAWDMPALDRWDAWQPDNAPKLLVYKQAHVRGTSVLSSRMHEREVARCSYHVRCQPPRRPGPHIARVSFFAKLLPPPADTQTQPLRLAIADVYVLSRDQRATGSLYFHAAYPGGALCTGMALDFAPARLLDKHAMAREPNGPTFFMPYANLSGRG